MAGTEGAENFQVARVISRAFEVLGSNPLLYFGLSLLLSGVPNFLAGAWRLQTMGTGFSYLSGFGNNFWSGFGVVMLVALITNAVLQASLTRATVTKLSGTEPTFAGALTTGLSMILPVAGISVLIGIGLTVIAVVVMVPLLFAFAGLAISGGGGMGMVSLMPLTMLVAVIPIVIVYILWSVTIPAYVTERPGIIEAFGRSIELTKGARWKIFLLFVVIAIGAWLFGLMISWIAAALSANSTVIVAISTLAGVFSGTVMVMIVASIYVELRNVKEGVEPSDLEAIFA